MLKQFYQYEFDVADGCRQQPMLLLRLKNLQELYLICVTPEIDTVHKANQDRI